MDGVRPDDQAKVLANKSQEFKKLSVFLLQKFAAQRIHYDMPSYIGNYLETPPENLIQNNQGTTPLTSSRPSFDRT